MKSKLSSDNGKVSVIVPYFNDSEKVYRAYESIKNQNVYKCEIIIVDDCSNDSQLIPKCILSDPAVVYSRNAENKNAAYSRNFGVSISTGDYVAFLDADDFWKEDHLLQSISHMRLNDVMFVYSNVIHCDNKGRERRRKVVDFKHYSKDICDILLISAPQTNSFVCRKEVFKYISFDEKLRRHQDYQFFIDALEACFDVSYLDAYTSYHCNSHRTLKSRYNLNSAFEFWSKYENKIDRDLYANYLWLSAYLSVKTNSDFDLVLNKLDSYLGVKLPNNIVGKVLVMLYFNARYRIFKRIKK
ncbi:glycosyltransferase family 2 protein [Vibrio breoganii]